MRREIVTELRGLDVSRPKLRSFGLVVGGVFAAIAAVLFWRAGWVWTTAVQVLGGLGGGLVVLGLLAPVVLRPVFRVWMGLALVLGAVMTRVLLSLVFALAVVPIGLVRRALGKDPLARRPDPAEATYWIPREAPSAGPERLEKYY